MRFHYVQKKYYVKSSHILLMEIESRESLLVPDSYLIILEYRIIILLKDGSQKVLILRRIFSHGKIPY